MFHKKDVLYLFTSKRIIQVGSDQIKNDDKALSIVSDNLITRLVYSFFVDLQKWKHNSKVRAIV